jgi:hypothetical protein
MPATLKAAGNPSKAFFINMITRDISLTDCMLDLLDNSVDGINRLKHGSADGNGSRYTGFNVKLQFGERSFSISDNCGGIPIKIAQEYAFRFGRPDDVITETDQSIGLYGIGMKRAMFKMGKDIHLTTSTGEESFNLAIDVDQWRERQPETDWDFDLTDVKRTGTTVPVGTTIKMGKLYQGIRRDFEAPAFAINVNRTVERDYAFILHQGLEIKVNDKKAKPIMPTFRESDQIAPMKKTKKIGDVDVEITAGLASPPPEDDSADAPLTDMDVYGWYVVCNDRVVVTADKSILTGWGTPGVGMWHPQYYGFLGIAKFDSQNPELLPWKTTKRDVDPSSTVFKSALLMMKEASAKYIDYTNKRKSELKKAREIERAAPTKPITQIARREVMKLPTIQTTGTSRICYSKPTAEVEAVAKALGMRTVSPRAVGIRTFDYVKDHEVE